MTRGDNSTAEAGLSFRDVEEILRIIEEFHALEIRFEHRDLKLHLRRAASDVASRPPGQAGPPIPPLSTLAPQAPPPSQIAPAPSSVPLPASPTAPTGIDVVAAPMGGTFYAAVAPGAEPFVVRGATVEAGTDLCIIEVMKVMNRLKAPCAGKIVEILVEDASAIGTGQALMWIEPLDPGA